MPSAERQGLARRIYKILAAEPILLLALTVGAILRFTDLGATELHFDEALSVLIARGSWSEILAKNLAYNSSPPFMVLALNQALSIGESETIVRILPALAGMGTIFLIYNVCKSVVSNHWAALAALLVAVSPAHVVLSRQFRIYEIGCFFAALALLAAVKFHAQPNLRKAILLGAAIFIGVQIQYGLAPFFLGIMGALAVSLAKSYGVKRISFALGIVSIFALAGIGTVYFVSLRHQFYSGRGSTYIKAYSGGAATKAAIAGKRSLELAKYAMPSDLFLFALVAGFLLLLGKSIFDVSVLMLVFGMAIMGVLGVLNYYPYAAVRQCLVLTLPMYPVAVFGLQQCKAMIGGRAPRWLAGLAVLVLVQPALLECTDHLRSNRGNPVSTAIEEIERNFRDGDVVFVAPGSYPHFLYYGRAFPHPWIKGNGSEAWMSDERAWKYLASRPPYIEQMESLMRSHKRVWFLFTFRLPGEPELSELADGRWWEARIRSVVKSPEITLALYE